MRDRQTIEREMFEARQNLAQRLGSLRLFVRDKLDIPARVRVSLAEKRQHVRELAHGRVAVVVAAVAACLALGLAFLVGRRMTRVSLRKRRRRLLLS